MQEENRALIEKFYSAFQRKDAEFMAACYADDIVFEDPAFGILEGENARNMWRMLTERGGKGLQITFSDITADQHTGSAKWEAKYTFGKTGRPVHNIIQANFEFKGGRIIKHKDHFNFWKWSRMALGPLGFFLGFTAIFRNKVRSQVLDGLKKYSEAKKT